MKKSRLFLKIGAGLLAVGLIVFCCSLTFSFTGNPLVMLMAKSTAKHYVEETYPELDLNIGVRSLCENSSTSFCWLGVRPTIGLPLMP